MDVPTSTQSNILNARIVIFVAVALQICYGAPLEDQKRSVDATTAAECTGKEFYWDSEKETCNMCTLCQIGWGSTHNCGFGSGRRSKCTKCEDGLNFQTINGSSAQCTSCSTCDGKVVEAECTSKKDIVCGGCKDGFARHPGMPELCSLCKLFNHDEQPLECPQIEPTGTHLSSPFPGTSLSSPVPVLEDQGSQFPGWAVAVISIVAVAVAVVAIICVALCCVVSRRSRGLSQSKGRQRYTDIEMDTFTDCVAMAKIDDEQSNGRASINAPHIEEERKEVKIHDNPTEKSTLLTSRPNDVEELHLSDDEADKDVGLNCKSSTKYPIQVESTNASERSTKQKQLLGKTTTQRKQKILLEGENPDEPSSTQPLSPEEPSSTQPLSPEEPSSTQPLSPDTPSSTQPLSPEDERKEKKKKFEDNFQKACTFGRKIHWEDLEPGTRTTCTEMMTREDRSSSHDFRTLGEMLKLKRKTELKVCNNLDNVFAKLHETRSVPVDMEEVLQRLREMRRMDVLRLLVGDIIKKKPTCQCVS